IGEGVVEGEIVKWLVKAGDQIVEDQPLVEVMTDKATVTIPSPRRGKVVRTFGNEGDIAKVHSTLVVLELEGGGAVQATPSTGAHGGAGAGRGAAAARPAQEHREEHGAEPCARRAVHLRGRMRYRAADLPARARQCRADPPRRGEAELSPVHRQSPAARVRQVSRAECLDGRREAGAGGEEGRERRIRRRDRAG